ncbi:hypothetical protein WJX75_004635 [Coccomyxa subellipsoidea]|uniref:Uncharacterized protein n=1 Tax=Coccomyxa subellipsoidea TaxID=248742 RepID=A0ABR2YAY4_9CHLO
MMLRRGLPAVLTAICLLGFSCSRLADAQNSNAAIAQTLQSASNNPQIAGTSAKTGAAAAPLVSRAAASNQPAATAQSVQPTSLQASDVNNALLQATNIATQVLQNAPPAQAIIPAGTTTTTNSITIPRGQDQSSVTLNPDGVTLNSSPDAPSMTIGNAGVRYNEPEVNPIPEQAAGSLFPGQGLSVVQNHPINDQGTGPAPVSKSNFQPLGTSLGGVTTPAQNAAAALDSMGQGGHNSNKAIGQQQNSNPYFRNANTASTQKTQSYAAQIPANAQGAAADPNAVTLTGPGGNSVSLGRRLLREASLDDL